MEEKKREGAIGYRPSEEIKKVFEKYCPGGASITRPQLIEVAMRFLLNQGEDKMRDIVTRFLLGEMDINKGLYKEKISPSRQHLDEPQKKIV